MKKIVSLIGLMGCLAAAPAAQAAYPERPIRMMVPASAGGAADALARMVGKEMAEELGQPVIVENRAGAAAIVGMTSIARSEPDGYHIGMSFAGAMSINPSLYEGLQYDPETDIDPIAIGAISPLVMTVNSE